jgi:hypothetical protein
MKPFIIKLSIILISLSLTFSFSSCTKREIRGKQTLNIYYLDGCEYLGSLTNSSTDLLEHYPHCKFCAERMRLLLDHDILLFTHNVDMTKIIQDKSFTVNNQNIYTYVMDSCEYIGYLNHSGRDMYAHRGTCKFCWERLKHNLEVRSLSMNQLADSIHSFIDIKTHKKYMKITTSK